MRCAVLVGVSSLVLLNECQRHQGWQGWVYPDRNNLAESLPLGEFASLPQCRAAARNVITRLEKEVHDSEPVQAAYECGFKCKPSGMGGLNVCERTER